MSGLGPGRSLLSPIGGLGWPSE
ncbi:uncharacterized protein G2W53_017608 [Senna tora]|uniref:Uncharacterized protein n=1 Tax=Senna tora TaxID=362788 RepID=A0A834WQY5_9FABA|nr:uncharacterized protein G2W53_017608 [Senna tora]